jgi:hypothetical protein
LTVALTKSVQTTFSAIAPLLEELELLDEEEDELELLLLELELDEDELELLLEEELLLLLLELELELDDEELELLDELELLPPPKETRAFVSVPPMLVNAESTYNGKLAVVALV